MTGPGTTIGSLRQWPRRRVIVAVVAAGFLALAVGIPTGIVPTPVYTRMAPVLWWNYPVWGLTALLGGLLTATYVRRPQDRAPRSGAGVASGGGLLAAFAVGCPICNKLVVGLLGVSGALTIWAPLQPLVGAVSVLGLAVAFWRRVHGEFACPVPTRAPSGTKWDPECPVAPNHSPGPFAER